MVGLFSSYIYIYIYICVCVCAFVCVYVCVRLSLSVSLSLSLSLSVSVCPGSRRRRVRCFFFCCELPLCCSVWVLVTPALLFCLVFVFARLTNTRPTCDAWPGSGSFYSGDVCI